jgi:hypothetical protein
MAWKRVTGWTSRVLGKTGSKIAAKYNASTGEALLDAIIDLSPGRRLLFWESDLSMLISES